MADIKWIKLSIDMFDNRKIKYLRKLPEGNSIVLIWVMLLTIAGRCNSGGMIFLTENIPYDLHMLASELDFEPTTVKLALDALEKLGMIQCDESQFFITGWAEHQNIEGMERAKEKRRDINRRYYEKRKALLAENPAEDKTSYKTSDKTDSDAVEEEYRIENQKEELREENQKEESEEDISDDYIGSKDPICRPKDVRRVVEEWNKVGVNPVMKVTLDSTRGKMLRARVKEYGVDKVIEAINRISSSPFLMGSNDRGWQITFEWFVKPNNFIKVLEGNYDARQGSSSGGKGKTPRSFTPTEFE